MTSGSRIVSIKAREVFSNRGHPGVEAMAVTADGSCGVAMATAGLSIGKHEVQFAYDGEERFAGLGVLKAVANVHDIIAPALMGVDASRQREVDGIMIDLDGTPNKTNLGGNATAAVSAAVLKAGAASLGLPLYQHIGGCNASILPVPCAGAFNGSGRYGGGPQGATVGDKPSYSFPCYGFDTYSEAAYATWEVARHFRKVMAERFDVGAPTSGYSGIRPGMVSHDRELWAAMTEAIERSGYLGQVGIQIDVAAGTYLDEESGVFSGLFFDGSMTQDELIDTYKNMVASFPVVVLEDPLGEEDYVGHAQLVDELGIQIVGDDLFTTNPERLQMGIDVGGANAMLLKVNQVGTITEAFDAVEMCYRAGYGVMPCSSRGEGEALCDYVVGLGCGQTREGGAGPMANRYMEIEAELGARAKFLGKNGLKVDWSRISG